MSVRNPRFSAGVGIDCEVHHPQFGWIPYTAQPNDTEAHGGQIYAAALAMGPLPYVPTDPAEILQLARDAAYLYRADFCTALMSLGILSHADAIEASRGGWPAAMQGFLVYLTEPQAAVAQIEWASAATIRRMNYLVLTLQSFLGLTDAQVDAIFGL